ncbi:hypothetical protein H4696_008668 [Amycolatopsis lexingtonensis]|uniref:DUF4436 domain-containing protein n=1 Tax=Amycolatopsis lexingtonensis TaxID=218822 RepID=A0ABR9IEF0_9PSEU|nr:hypothetical protein [Amycolatopsis lexingtonensis]MBE1501568.1 hypothetical protein [Amycolatopsis lexingtonensis]
MGRVIAAGVALGLCAVVLGAPAASADSGSLEVQVSIDQRPIEDATVPIDPASQVELKVVATNSGTAPVKVRSVRLSGVALALTFFAYDTTAPFEVPARGSATRTFVLDLGDLSGQATGLLPSSVELLDAQRATLGEATTVADVRGSVWSVYGVFGLAMLVLTILAWAAALLALARHRLAPNRWRRGLRFLPAGFGTGLVAVISLSVLRLVPPEPAIEIPVVLGAAAIAFLLGYLTPHPAPPAVTPAEDGSTVRLPLPSTQEFTR